VIFIMIKAINQLQRPPEAASPDAKDCPYCFSKIPIKSTRCPQCTSQLEPAERAQVTA
jgi:large conductance mechanosensitive channel